MCEGNVGWGGTEESKRASRLHVFAYLVDIHIDPPSHFWEAGELRVFAPQHDPCFWDQGLAADVNR